MTLTEQMKADGWIEHDGKGPPWAGAKAIYVMLRCGIMGWVMSSASAWEHRLFSEGVYFADPTDIIAYRPNPEQPQ